jgi:glutathione synthase/RimK-type ligase-like ATP-grasp enzyme
MRRLLLVAATTGYQVREFAEAARALDVELVLATDRCHILENPWGDDAAPVRFEDPEPGIEALVARGPFDGILAVGDRPACVAAQAAEHLGNLRFHPAEAARAASNKLLSRERFRAAGMPVPEFRLLRLTEARSEALVAGVRFPCVLKPLDSSASRGVIRANNREEFRAAVERISRMQTGDVLVENYIPGREFALEGVVTGGTLQTLALFDKPDPLEGPYFEETIYATPSRQPEPVQRHIRETAQAAVTALGLEDGPVHAEMRVNEHGIWILEAAARPIGGLCARVLRFAPPHKTLEQLLLRHALGEDVSGAILAPGSHGVMMIPIPHAGVYRGVQGLEDARRVPGVEDIVITAKEGQEMLPLPEGSAYLGFLFFRGESADLVLEGLREVHQRLTFVLSAALPVVK